LRMGWVEIAGKHPALVIITPPDVSEYLRNVGG